MEYGIQKLKGGAEVNIGKAAGKCKKCGAVIFWAVTKGGKTMPVIYKDGWQSHFADCPNAQEFRKDRKELIDKVEQRAGKVFGIPIVVADNLKNQDYTKGFADGREYMRKEVIKILMEK